MGIRVESVVEEGLRAHAEEGFPDEVCGILVGRFLGPDVEVVRVRRAPNGAGVARGSSFAIHPRDILAAEGELAGSGLEIVGFYHSHPNVPSAPSRSDQEHAWALYAYAIVSVTSAGARDVSWWRRAGGGALREETVVRPRSSRPAAGPIGSG
jgi:proteasome lid subunit RPN8/RPN11